ncbi:ATP-binding cassette domain-containing protein [Rhodoferax sp. TBRC 17660]|uniref:ATP-binding cassette domain-containing protein n=1 Tax=Rhodoferax potami TaxID=3068338 RepID=A0ABU3KKA4_9BURK|nr:ATP-binding cassette domain-containing protein [Rhodoferax sp. TBRC 17660]MDT7518209.1 ATP-binding cassette domain-containing protein [Rhodoferax sp. TBRC 17660]
MSLDIHITQLASPAGDLLRSLHIHVPDGKVHTLMGPSGCGKSSVLAAVCGTLDHGMLWDGRVTLHDQRIESLPVQARRVGLLFQDDLLFAHMTVRENLLFAVPAGERQARERAVEAALDDVEMREFLHANPARLSGGQRARVALARALLAQPRCLLLDEPFSKLDAALRERMRALVFGLVAQRAIPALLVTHDLADVADPQHLTRLDTAGAV